MARDGNSSTKLARDLPKFRQVLKNKGGEVKALSGNVSCVEVKWDLNELCKRDQVFEIRMGDKYARISKQALDHYIRAI